jgi:hypothetical protein
MTTERHSQFEHFLWSICNLIRGLHKSEDHREVMLPLTIRRHFEFLKHDLLSQASFAASLR